jgi:hypothetical protein
MSKEEMKRFLAAAKAHQRAVDAWEQKLRDLVPTWAKAIALSEKAMQASATVPSAICWSAAVDAMAQAQLVKEGFTVFVPSTIELHKRAVTVHLIKAQRLEEEL